VSIAEELEYDFLDRLRLYRGEYNGESGYFEELFTSVYYINNIIGVKLERR
jgi:hypothetical protein